MDTVPAAILRESKEGQDASPDTNPTNHARCNKLIVINKRWYTKNHTLHELNSLIKFLLIAWKLTIQTNYIISSVLYLTHRMHTQMINLPPEINTYNSKQQQQQHKYTHRRSADNNTPFQKVNHQSYEKISLWSARFKQSI